MLERAIEFYKYFKMKTDIKDIGQIQDSQINDVGNGNFLEICRSCIVNRGVINIFQGYYHKLSFSELIYLFTSEKISRDDGLPEIICSSCSKLLIDSYLFVRRLRHNQTHIRKLHQILQQTPADVETLNNFNVSILKKQKLFKMSTEIKLEKNYSCEDLEEDDNQMSPISGIFDGINANYPDIMAKYPIENSLSNKFEKCFEYPLELNTDKFSFVEYLKLTERFPVLQEISDQNQTNKNDDKIDIELKTFLPTDRATIISQKKVENTENYNFGKFSENNSVVTPKNSGDTIEVITVMGLESEEEIETKLKTDVSDFSSEKHNPSTKKINEFQCFECLKNFKTMQNMLKHSKETGHVIPPRFKCEVCSKAFKTSKVFKAHSKRHTQENPKSICDICGATILTRNLKRHLQTHGGKSNVCQYCAKSFTQKGTLLFHIRSIHEGVSPHMLCYICGKVYARLAELNRHLNRHTDEELKDCPYRCELCRKCFTSAASLSLHHSYHNGPRKLKEVNHKPAFRKEKNYNINLKLKSLRECPVCKKKISSNGFRKHLHMHEDFRPFQCSICGKKFRQHPHLKSHMNIHLGLKNHKCEFCKKQFRHMTTWITHTRMHTGETPFVCSVCDKGFYHSSTMKKHVETHTKNRSSTKRDIKVTFNS